MITDIFEKLKKLRHLALDMDGTLYSGKTLFPYTHDFFRSIRSLGIGYTFLTNNSSRSVSQYLEKIRGLGLEATEEQIFISSLATIEHLRSEYPGESRLYVLGTPGLKDDFSHAGYEIMGEGVSDEPDLVVVGFDTGLTYERLCRASYWISKGKPFIATHPDAVCPTDQPTVLVDCGAVTAAITTATGVEPVAVPGKPNPLMLKGILSRYQLETHELGMVGDRLYTDIAMARRAGVVGILVLSGEATEESLAASPHTPDIVVKDIRELADILEKAKQ